MNELLEAKSKLLSERHLAELALDSAAMKLDRIHSEIDMINFAIDEKPHAVVRLVNNKLEIVRT